MKEQSWQYTVCVASIHLAMIRYILFYYLSLVSASFCFSELRNQISHRMMIFSYGLLAWQEISRIIQDILGRNSHAIGENLANSLNIEIGSAVGLYFQSLYPIALGIHPDKIRNLDMLERKGEL
jgi:hypothetical protein